MYIQITSPKDKMIMCRFDPATFKQIEQLATKHKASRSKVIRALVDQALNT